MATSDDAADREPKQLIYEMRREVQRVRNKYWQEGVNGGSSDKTHLELAARTLQYYDVLYEHRDEESTDKDDWPDISPLRDRVNRHVKELEESAGRGRSVTMVERPAVLDIPVGQIIAISEELDDLAKRLGFSAAVNENTPRTKLDGELLEEVEEWRKENIK